MSIVDILVYVSVFVLAIWFAWHGFLEQMMILLTLAVAVWAGIYFADQVGELFEPYIVAEWVRQLTGGVISFFLVLAIGFWLARLLVAVARMGKLLWLNRLLGVLFGILMGFVSVWVVLSVVALLPVDPSLRERGWWRDSHAISFVMSRGARVVELMNAGVTAVADDPDAAEQGSSGPDTTGAEVAAPDAAPDEAPGDGPTTIPSSQ